MRAVRRSSGSGARPAGSSVSVEVSRSPKTVIATVRGIGVAVITSTCGGSDARLGGQRGALLDAEPVLLVDDDEAEVGELHAVLEQGVGADDDARRSRRDVEQRLPAGGRAQRAGEQRDPGAVARPRRASRRRRGRRASRSIERWCCWASTSVGASRAAWPPESTTRSIARSATTVLPEPTSPCSSRCIGCAGGEVAEHLVRPSLLALGQRRTAAARRSGRAGRPSRPGARLGRASARMSARRWASTVWVTNASSKRSRCGGLRPLVVPVGVVHPLERLRAPDRPSASVVRRRAARPAPRRRGRAPGVDGAGDLPGLDARGRGVDRHQHRQPLQAPPWPSSRPSCPRAEHLALGVGELPAVAEPAELAGERGRCARHGPRGRRSRRGAASWSKNVSVSSGPVGLQQHLEAVREPAGAAVAVGPALGGRDPGQDRDVLVGDRVLEAAELVALDVAARVVPQQVADRAVAERLLELRRRRARDGRELGVPGDGGHGPIVLLDTDEKRVARLAAVVDDDVDRRVGVADVRRRSAPRGRRRRRRRPG